jgi:hypothetical protein
MSEAESRRAATSKYSLRHLLTLTALIAVGVAVGLAYRNKQSLTQQRDGLLALSKRLKIRSFDELATAAMPPIADDFDSWQVYVPEGLDCDLLLGIGAISEKAIPPIVGSVRIPSGQHRVTLYTGDSASEQFRYVVYLDGEQVIEKTMGSDWMKESWSSSSGVGWPNRTKPLSLPLPTPLQLASQSYEARTDFGPNNYFNGQKDSYVTQLGYRLWIDQPSQTYKPASLFMGFTLEPQHMGIGLRDGLRYRTSTPPHQWTFTRPQLATTEPVLRIEAEFFTNDGTLLSSQNQSFQSWEIRNAAIGTEGLAWQADPDQATRTAFLHAISSAQGGLKPVVEMKWDTARPDEVGIRLADTPANGPINRWRLRVLDGSYHLWRELKINERSAITPDEAINAGETPDHRSSNPSSKTAKIDLAGESSADQHVLWQTDQPLPLQFLDRKDKRYSGMWLYRGLPLKLGIQIPTALKPSLAVEVSSLLSTDPETTMPGGPVYDAIQFEFDANSNEWIWFSAKQKD